MPDLDATILFGVRMGQCCVTDILLYFIFCVVTSGKLYSTKASIN